MVIRASLVLVVWSSIALAGLGPDIETAAPKAPLPPNAQRPLRRLRPLNTWTTQFGPYFSYVGIEVEGGASTSGFARGGDMEISFTPDALAPFAFQARTRITRVDLGSESAPPTYEASLAVLCSLSSRFHVWAGGSRMAGVFAVPGNPLQASSSWGLVSGVVWRTSRRNASGLELGAQGLMNFSDGIGYRLTATGIVPVSSALGFRVGLEGGQWFWRRVDSRQTVLTAGTTLGAAWLF